MSYDYPMPPEIMNDKVKKEIDGTVYETIPSWNDRRYRQWDKEIAVTFEDSKLKLCWSEKK